MIVESVFVLALSLAAEPEFKCPATHRLPGFPERAAAMIIDGEVRGNNIDFDPNDLSPEDIGRLEVKCWNPETDAIPASEGVPLIVIWTNSALEDAHSKTLGVAERLQEFEEANGRLPTSLETLGPDVDGYQIETGVHGWILTAPEVTDLACSISKVTIEAGEGVRCKTVYTLARRSLREALERGQQTL